MNEPNVATQWKHLLKVEEENELNVKRGVITKVLIQSVAY